MVQISSIEAFCTIDSFCLYVMQKKRHLFLNIILQLFTNLFANVFVSSAFCTLKKFNHVGLIRFFEWFICCEYKYFFFQKIIIYMIRFDILIEFSWRAAVKLNLLKPTYFSNASSLSSLSQLNHVPSPIQFFVQFQALQFDFCWTIGLNHRLK